MIKKSPKMDPIIETKRCFIYACESSNRKGVDEANIQTQVADCQKYAERNGWEVIRVITDEYRSSDDDQRPGFLELSNAISGAKMEILLVRRLEHLISCTDQLKNFLVFTMLNRVALRSVAEDGPGGSNRIRVEFYIPDSDFAEE